MRGLLLTQQQTQRVPQPRRGFTLVETLVVIGLIAGLIAVIAVVATKARGKANKFQLAAQLQAIAVGLDAYKTEFGSYPITQLDDSVRTATGTAADNEINLASFRGARTLCKALIGAGPQGTVTNPFVDAANQDGADGPGFRVMPRSGVFQVDPSDATKYAGKVYGPFISGTQLTWAKTDSAGAILGSDKSFDDTTVLLDANGNPILYYPVLNPQAPINLPGAFVMDTEPTSAATNVSTPMYRGRDNAQWLSVENFRKALGDTTANAGPGGAPDGAINAGTTTTEKPSVRGKYILWSAGPDGAFGVNAPKDNKPDDVTNFELE
jgi:type II secretory pathway pseudopilin PulG